MTHLIRACWTSFSQFAATFGGFQMFSLRLLPYLPKAILRPRLITEQIYSIGALSLVLIMFGGFFVGTMLALQSYSTLVEFGQVDSLGAFATEALVRELGPVVATLLFVGRAGSAVAAEVGLMRATNQIAAMELMAVDPIQRLIVPRFIAGVISLPLLVAIFCTMGVLGAYLIGVHQLGVDPGAFWSHIQERVDLYEDVGSGLLKSLVFGISASLMCVYEGFHADPTAAGVSRAATRTVVITSVWVLLFDFILTGMMMPGG
ncbi:MAG: ABC transporter permease [Proteobacteria bacterium]|nr:ABC transporter permease [Pseudomonadota bacterium]